MSPSFSPVFCHVKYRGGVTQGEGLENTDSGGDRVRTPLPLLIVDVIGEVTCRAGEVKETGKRCKIYPCVEMGITILIFSPCCIVALLDISYSFLRIARDWNDIIGVVFKTSSLPCPVALRGCFAMQNIGEVSRSDGGVGKYWQWRWQKSGLLSLCSS